MNATDRLVAALQAAGLMVGDGEPRDASGALTGRYVIVRHRMESRGEGSIGDPNTDREPELQITAVGPSRRAADQVAEQARAVALGPLDPPTGWSWTQTATYVTGSPTDVEALTDPAAAEAPTWYRADVYRFYLTPG